MDANVSALHAEAINSACEVNLSLAWKRKIWKL